MTQNTNCVSHRELAAVAFRMLQHPNQLTVSQLRNLTARADEFINQVYGTEPDLEAVRTDCYNGDYLAHLVWRYIMGENYNGSSSSICEEELPF